MPTVTSLGSTSAITSGTTIVLTITQNVAVGEEIFVGSGIAVNTGTEVQTITDSGVNSWTKDVEHVHSSGVPYGALHHAVCTVALTSGVSTLTATNTVGNVNARHIGAFKLAAGDVLSPIATNGSNSNEGTTSTSVTPGSVTPNYIPDFGVFLSIVGAAATRTGTPPGTWTEMFDFGSGGADNLSMQMNYLTALTSSLTALNDTETLNLAPTAWVAMQVLYKAPVGGTPPAKDIRGAVPFMQGAGGGSPGGGF